MKSLFVESDVYLNTCNNNTRFLTLVKKRLLLRQSGVYPESSRRKGQAMKNKKFSFYTIMAVQDIFEHFKK